jgi:hypothetical protein
MAIVAIGIILYNPFMLAKDRAEALYLLIDNKLQRID